MVPCALWTELRILGAILGRRVTVFDGQTGAEHAGGGAGVAAGDEQVAAADAEIQIAGLKFRKFNAQFLCLFLGIHAGRLPRGGAGCNGIRAFTFRPPAVF